MKDASDGDKAMSTVVLQGTDIRVPSWVVDLDSFHRWVDSDDVPEHVRIDYLNGEVWIDMGGQQIFSHLLVITEFTRALATLAAESKRGVWLTDGLRVTHTPTGFSAVPDGAFLQEKSLRAGRVRLVEGADDGYIRVEGPPDVVLEVVSPISEPKDTVQLRNDYWQIGVREYWLVNARRTPPAFDILRRAK